MSDQNNENNELKDIYPNGPTEPTAEEIKAAQSEEEEVETSVLDELVNNEAQPQKQAAQQDENKQQDETAEEKTDDEQAGETQTSETDTIEQTLKDTAESDPAIKGLIGDLQSERSKRQQVEKQLADLNARLEAFETSKSPVNQQWDDKERPTSEEAMAIKYGLDDDDVLTVGQYRELRANQRERMEFERQRKTVEETTLHQRQNVVAAAEQQFVTSLDQKLVEGGLAVENVVNPINTLNLTGKDWRDFYAIPVGSVERANFIYNKIIERTPELRARRDSLLKVAPVIKKEPKPASIPKGGRSAAQAADEAAETSSDQFHSLVNKTEEELDAMLKESAMTVG